MDTIGKRKRVAVLHVGSCSHCRIQRVGEHTIVFRPTRPRPLR